MRDKKLFVERRPQGDYAVRRSGAQRPSTVTPSQSPAIKQAKQMDADAAIFVERVRNTSVGKRDKWRRP